MLDGAGRAGSRPAVNSGNVASNTWTTLGGRSVSTSRRQQQQQQCSPSQGNKSTLTLRSRSRSRSRSAALHCLAVPEPSDDEEEEEADDSFCYADWHQQESYQPALVVWTPGLNHPTSTPIKTATLRSALRSSITNNGD